MTFLFPFALSVFYPFICVVLVPGKCLSVSAQCWDKQPASGAHFQTRLPVVVLLLIEHRSRKQAPQRKMPRQSDQSNEAELLGCIEAAGLNMSTEGILHLQFGNRHGKSILALVTPFCQGGEKTL